MRFAYGNLHIINSQYMIFNVASMIDQQDELLHSQIKRCEDLFTLLDGQSEHIASNLSDLNGEF